MVAHNFFLWKLFIPMIIFVTYFCYIFFEKKPETIFKIKPSVDLYSGLTMFPPNYIHSLLSSCKNMEIMHQDLDFSIHKWIQIIF